MFNVINSSLMKNSLNIKEFSRTPENIQGKQDVFQESRTKRILIANSRRILGAQGRLGTLAGVDFSKEEPEPEWSRSKIFNKRLVCLF